MRASKHKAQEQQDNELRAYNRLLLRKKDKPYHERYYALHILAIIFGWSANIISGITESTKIYAFFYSFLAPYSFAGTATWILVIMSVALLEIFHRLISKSYFKDLVENDTHTKDMTPKLLVMVFTAVFLTSLSFTGGFDLIRLSQEKPTSIIAQTLDATQINNSIGAIADSLNMDADEYRSTRKWQNRLSTQDAQEWKAIQREKREMQKLQAQALLNIGQINKDNQIQTDSLNTQKQSIYEHKINQRGYGLGFVAIFAMLVLYICLWYDEEYQERKITYLEKKYGHLFDPIAPSSTQEQDAHILSSHQSPPDGARSGSTNGTVHNSTNNQNELSGSETPKNDYRPIGFFTASGRAEMNTPSNDHTKHSGQVWTDVDRAYLDQYTVPHTYQKNKKPVTVHYTMRMVNSRISQYERDIQDAISRELHDDVLENRRTWLTYWQGKRTTLMQKHSIIFK